jgi:hypothetical protein
LVIEELNNPLAGFFGTRRHDPTDGEIKAAARVASLERERRARDQKWVDDHQNIFFGQPAYYWVDRGLWLLMLRSAFEERRVISFSWWNGPPPCALDSFGKELWQKEEAWDRLKPGMSQQQARDILGEPSKVSSDRKWAGREGMLYWRFQTVDFGVGEVWFDAEGKVERSSKPWVLR